MRLSRDHLRHAAFPAFLVYVLLLVTLHEYGMFERTMAVQLLCLAAALLWVATRRSGVRRHARWQRGSVAVFLALAAMALGLRFYLLTFLPPSNQTGFEEMETGRLSWAILRTGVLPLEFRYTTCLGALGFRLGGVTLEALRAPFELTAGFVPVLLILCLRDLRVGWLPTGLVVITAASLRWLVIGSVADELFSGLPLVAAVVFCIVRSERSAEGAPGWASLAGLISGLLMYEYPSFRVTIGFAWAWYLWKGVEASRGGRSGPARRLLSSFSVPLLLVSLPLLVEVALNPEREPFFEAFRRHGGERPALLAAQSLEHVIQYASALAGRVVPTTLWLTRLNEPVVPPMIGGLFLAAFLLSMVRPRHPVERGLVLTIFALVVSASLTANDLKVGRLLPAVFPLLVMSGLLLERLTRWLRRMGSARKTPEEKPIRPRLRGPATELVLFSAGALSIVLSNVRGVREMAVDPFSLQEFANDDYATACSVAHAAREGQSVLICKPDTRGQRWELGDMRWVFASKRLQARVSGRLPDRESIAAGTLVLVGVRGRALPAEGLEELRTLAERTGSLSSLRRYRNAAGNLSAASICVLCGPGDTPVQSSE